MPVPPREDVQLAAKRGLTFRVMDKSVPRGRWQLRLAGIASLERAADIASDLEGASESGIFVETSAGGFLYWTSRDADLFNSIVLQKGYS